MTLALSRSGKVLNVKAIAGLPEDNEWWLLSSDDDPMLTDSVGRPIVMGNYRDHPIYAIDVDNLIAFKITRH